MFFVREVNVVHGAECGSKPQIPQSRLWVCVSRSCCVSHWRSKADGEIQLWSRLLQNLKEVGGWIQADSCPVCWRHQNTACSFPNPGSALPGRALSREDLAQPWDRMSCHHQVTVPAHRDRESSWVADIGGISVGTIKYFFFFPREKDKVLANCGCLEFPESCSSTQHISCLIVLC